MVQDYTFVFSISSSLSFLLKGKDMIKIKTAPNKFDWSKNKSKVLKQQPFKSNTINCTLKYMFYNCMFN